MIINRALLAALALPAAASAQSPVSRAGSVPATPTTSQPAAASAGDRAWQDKNLSADQRADLLVRAMTEDEKLTVVTGFFGTQQDWNAFSDPQARLQSAGFVPGYRASASRLSGRATPAAVWPLKARRAPRWKGPRLLPAS
jgi:hypothetical protein